LVGVSLPDAAAEDSYDMLPVLLGRQDESVPVRPYNLTQSFHGEFQIRRGPWEFLDHKGSGGNDYTAPDMRQYALPELDPGAPGQLYNLDEDPGETTNLYSRRPDIVQEMKALLEKAKSGGRSAPLQRTPLAARDGKGASGATMIRRRGEGGGILYDYRGRKVSLQAARTGVYLAKDKTKRVYLPQ
jgi:arylsulfatase A